MVPKFITLGIGNAINRPQDLLEISSLLLGRALDNFPDCAQFTIVKTGGLALPDHTMDSEFTIRALAIADYDALLTLWQRAGLTHRPRGRDSREKIEQELAAAPHSHPGLFVGDRLVAAVIATFDGRKGWINRVAVDPDFRGRGYGQRMIAEAEAVLRKQHGALVIAALIEQENDPSRQLFAKCGFAAWEGVCYYSKRDRPEV